MTRAASLGLLWLLAACPAAQPAASQPRREPAATPCPAAPAPFATASAPSEHTGAGESEPPVPGAIDGVLMGTFTTPAHVDLVALDLAATPLSPACEAFAAAICRSEQRCAPKAFNADFATDDRCREHWSRWCKYEQTAPESGYTDAALTACAAALAKVPCRRWRDFDGLDVPACHPPGERHIGATCFTASQCQSGFCNFGVITQGPDYGDTTCGRCAPVVGIGDACTGVGFSRMFGCPRGSECGRGTCIERSDEGERCHPQAWTDSCYGSPPYGGKWDRQTSCDFSQPGGRCQLVNTTTTCAAAGDCLDEEICDRGTCTLPAALPGPGMACSAEPGCQAGFVCRDGSCHERSACGDAQPCLPPARCHAGRCVVVHPETCEAVF